MSNLSVMPGVRLVHILKADGTLDGSQAALVVQIGEVAASPTANTLLDRLKTLATLLTAEAALIGEVAASPTANTLLDRLKTLATSLAQIAKPSKGEYETVAASQTAQVLGATGAAGDYIKGVLLVPANVNPGAVALLDGATSIPVFAGGATSVADLKPFFVPLDMVAATAWKLTTGADISAIAVGDFT